MATVEEIRERKRLNMAKARLDPARRERMNASRRGNPKYIAGNRVYAQALRARHFFRWRARNWSRKGSVTAWQLMCLWKKQRGLCALSGRKLGRDAHLDHIVPLSRGGSSGIENLRWLDPIINQARQNMTDEQFLAMCNQVAEWIGRRVMEAMKANV
jgi:5-methylcytosine-specific restriction endonuclease McrA